MHRYALPQRRTTSVGIQEGEARGQDHADGPLTAAHPELQLQAAIDGLGFLMTLEGYAQAAIASGRLVALLDDWLPKSPAPFLYYPGRRQRPPSLTAFVAFVKEWRTQHRP